MAGKELFKPAHAKIPTAGMMIHIACCGLHAIILSRDITVCHVRQAVHHAGHMLLHRAVGA